MKSTLWFIESSNILFTLVCFLKKNRKTKHFVFIVSREVDNKNNIDIWKSILNRIENVDIVGEIKESSFNGKSKVNFSTLIKNNIKKDFLLPKNTTAVFRAGANIQKIYPPWKNSYTVIHGVGDYLLYGSKKIKKFTLLKLFFRKLNAFIEFLIKGKTNLNRNLGRKIAFNLTTKVENRNYYQLKIEYGKLKESYPEVARSFENNKLREKSSVKLLCYLPLSINSFQFTDDIKNKEFDLDKLYYDFLEYNLNSINSLTKNNKDKFSIYLQPHPSDCYCSKTKSLKYSQFIRTLKNRLKEQFEKVNYLGDFLDMNYSFVCPYELIESFLKPDFLLCCYPSASLVTSQLSSDQKFMINHNNDFLKKISQRWDKSLDNVYENDHLFRTINLIN